MKKVELKYITKNTSLVTEKKEIVKSKLSVNETGTFWKLRGINFTINPGEGIGLLGNNGSGKSSLIDILMGKEKQTTGFITTDMRVNCATTRYGIDKKVTGLENIKKIVFSANLDEFKANHLINAIINFSDLGEWLYCPVETFSEGQCARLSLSIALFVKPELVLIDNIFGILDLPFFKKVSKKIQNLKDVGVSFVISDVNVINIERFCERTLWLDFGEVQDFGATRDVMVQYEYSAGWFESLTVSERNDYLAKKQIERQSFDVGTIYEEFKIEQFKNGFTRKDEPKMRNAFYNERGSDPVKALAEKKMNQKGENKLKKKNGKVKVVSIAIVIFLAIFGIYDGIFAKTSLLENGWNQLQQSWQGKSASGVGNSKNKKQHDAKKTSKVSKSSESTDAKKTSEAAAKKASSSSLKAASIASSASESSAKASSESVQQLKDNTQTINVQNGDTLEGLASKYATTVDNIMKINGFTSSGDLKAGNIIRVPK